MKQIILMACWISLMLAGCVRGNGTSNQSKNVRIADIQGCGHYSPYQGKKVENIAGIVTSRVNNGFYLQDNVPDNLDCTSEAIFVFTQNLPEIRPGDLVSISGVVEEFYPGTPSDLNLPITEINLDELKILSYKQPLPTPVEIGGDGRKIPYEIIDDDSLNHFQPDLDGLDFFESLESMLVKVTSGRVVGARNAYNEVVILTEKYEPNVFSSAGVLLMTETDKNPERVILNMNSVNQDPINVGALLESPVIGIVDYEYGNYKVNTFGRITFIQGAPEQVDSLSRAMTTIRLASINVENLSRENGIRRFRKLANLVTNDLDSPEILVLQEVMDDSGIIDDHTVSAKETTELIQKTILDAGGPKYASVQLDPIDNSDGGIPGGNIRSIIFFKENDKINISKSGILPKNPMRIGEDSLQFQNTRKPLVLNLQINNREVVIIGVHLTSRGADSPLFGEAQPILEPEREKREIQASFINEFVSDLIKKTPDTMVLVVGDFNDYPWSNTFRNLKSKDVLIDIADQLSAEERFTYILDGNGFQLDTIFVSNLSALQKVQFQIPHVNTLLDYTLRVSDHDPIVFDFMLP